MQKPTTHFEQVFSQTDNIITYGDLYLSILIIALLFVIAAVWVKNVNRAT